MLHHDLWLITKKIIVGFLIFLVPLTIIAGILWVIQFFFFK